MRDRRDEERVVGDDGRAVDGAVELDLAEDLFLAAGGEDDEFAILGAAGAIGSSVAQALEAKGADFVVVGRNPDRLQKAFVASVRGK